MKIGIISWRRLWETLQVSISTKVVVAETNNDNHDMTESSNVNPLELQVHNLMEMVKTLTAQMQKIQNEKAQPSSNEEAPEGGDFEQRKEKKASPKSFRRTEGHEDPTREGHEGPNRKGNGGNHRKGLPNSKRSCTPYKLPFHSGGRHVSFAPQAQDAASFYL